MSKTTYTVLIVDKYYRTYRSIGIISETAGSARNLAETCYINKSRENVVSVYPEMDRRTK